MAESRRVHVVTDSCSDIPAALREEYDITMVPLHITFGNETFLSHVEITSEQFLDRLQRDPNFPKTAAPSTKQFEEAFREAIDADMDVLYVGVSSKLSGTINSARLAAEELPSDRIRIVDTLGMCMQEGWVVIEGARAAKEGKSLEECAARAEAAVARAECFAVLASLDYAYKGGRIGRASHIIGSALGIKPVINFIDGVLTPMERVRTWKKALGRATDMAIEVNPTDVGVLHSGNLKDAEAVASKIRSACPNANVLIDWCGPTITTYAGPGSIGILVLKSK